jgi:hypothetical protein
MCRSAQTDHGRAAGPFGTVEPDDRHFDKRRIQIKKGSGFLPEPWCLSLPRWRMTA